MPPIESSLTDHVLLVDAKPRIREAIGLLFQGHGIAVATADDADGLMGGGFDLTISKPIDPGLLVSVVYDVMVGRLLAYGNGGARERVVRYLRHQR